MSATQEPVHEENKLRDEITLLGGMLGDTVRDIAGQDALDAVEHLRRLAWDRRSEKPEAEKQMREFIAGLDIDRLRVATRAFTVFLDLANLAEDRQRVRVLRSRDREAYPDSRSESIDQAVDRLQSIGKTAAELQPVLDAMQIELVFTAHPTEAKRRSVRSKLSRLRELLGELDGDQLPAERRDTLRLMRAELAKLWRTSFIRPWRPSVMQEVERGLSIKPVLWEVLPRIMTELRNVLEEDYPGEGLKAKPCLRFGSWIGGDRDGHPGVTAEITEQTFQWLRDAAIDLHLKECNRALDSLSLSEQRTDPPSGLVERIAEATERWEEVEKLVAELPPKELCRRWLRVIRWRLRQTDSVNLGDPLPSGAYGGSPELAEDVAALCETVEQAPGGELLAGEVRAWLDRIEAFGFHLARLDVRQDGRRYREVLNELLKQTKLADDPASLDEAGRQKVLLDSIDLPIRLSPRGLSELGQDTLRMFDLLHRVVDSFGPEAIGGHVISMTKAPSDVLTVLWLWRQTGDGREDHAHLLPVIPLFETIEDLQGAAAILQGMFDAEPYREHLRLQGDKQTAMLGYSDSTKDGGYLSACWSLFQAQKELYALAAGEGVKLTFFHGRGGSLGRGGGPTSRSVASLPSGTFHGSLRLTEQGEVMADLYDDPRIAHRHLEQLMWSCLLGAGNPPEPPDDQRTAIMRSMADAALSAYRQLIEQPDFVQFFSTATPINEISDLPIGSRPAKRKSGGGLGGLDDLRAIPWVFSWTQCRALLPAWYGLGSGVAEVLKDLAVREKLRQMYLDWPFFKATIDNAELALAKTDLDIAAQYGWLTEDREMFDRYADLIGPEYRRSREAILTITQSEHLLENTQWLRESIRVRNRYIDPLNLIQVELLRRLREAPPEDEERTEELRHVARLSINGLAAGMRTSG